MITVSQEQLLNIMNTTDVSFLLGAGCSISSGCMNASKLVYEFKKRIYCNDTNQELSKFDYLSDELKKILDKHFDTQICDNEYSYYFKKCFPLNIARMQFIKEQFLCKQPSVGYKCFAKMLMHKKTKIVYTTNFDNLIEKSIKAINHDYDVCKQNDKYIPLTQNNLTITELHGDYNYVLPRNTIEELQALNEDTKNSILSCNSQILIIMGYSGADKSVMDALKEFVVKNKTKSIIWCAYNNQMSDQVQELMTFANGINEDSCICDFKGFDELCLNYYKQFLPKDSLIDCILDKNPQFDFSKNFSLSKKELLTSNLFKIETFPNFYKIEDVEYSKELSEKINDCYVAQFHNKNLYFIGDENYLKVHFPDKTVTKHLFNYEFINNYKTISIKLLKDYIKKCILNSNEDIKQYNRKLYFVNKKDNYNIYEGFSLDIHLIQNDIYLSYVQEFVYNGELNQSIKNQILKKFKSIRNDNAFVWMLEITKTLGHEFCLWNTSIKLNDNPLTLSDLPYTLIDEPNITTNNKDKNVSALKCIKNSGISKPLIIKDKIKVTILCPKENRTELSKYFKNLESTLNSKDGIYPDYLGFKKMFGIDISYNVYEFLLNDCKNFTFKQYCNFILQNLEKIKQSENSDLIVIYTPKELSRFEQSEDKENNLHDYIKLHAANKYVTQFISSKSINSTDATYKKIWNLAIAIYTKTIALPWQPDDVSTRNAFVGIGFGKSKNGIIVGCSQMFDSHGRGLQLLLKPVSSNARNPFMTELEAYDVGKSLCNMYYNYYPTQNLQNITIHKSTPFKKAEISGLEKSFSHIDNLELIQIEDKANIKAIKLRKNDEPHPYPLSRGTLIKINDNEAYLWTHGVVNSLGFNNDRPYVKGGKAYPSPILIRRFKGKLPLEEVAKNILMLTKMDYNSADILYSNVPVTIKYTDKVVDIIKQDSNNLAEVDFRFII